MKVAGDLAARRALRRLVSEDQSAETDFLRRTPAKILRRPGIVVAFDPDPVARVGHRTHEGDIIRRHARPGAAIVETVAKRYHRPGPQRIHQRRDSLERRTGIVGRQHLAAGRIRRAFFEVQVRYDQRPGRLPPQPAAGEQHQLLARHFAGKRPSGGRVGRAIQHRPDGGGRLPYRQRPAARLMPNARN